MVQNAVDRQRVETLGPAERIIQTLTTFTDHLYHGRPGYVIEDARTNAGVRWAPGIWKDEEDGKVFYAIQKTKPKRARIGVIGEDNKIRDGRRIVGEYREPGIFPEVATWLYQQVANIYEMDNEFAAHWASWAWAQDHRDLKLVLAAFMLVQNRFGEPITEDGEVLFHDDDFRAVGEAMVLNRAKHEISPKMLLRMGELLAVPGVVETNRILGFGQSARNPAMGRYVKCVHKWLRYREENPKMIEGLVEHGMRRMVITLAKKTGYKPVTSKFYELLRWKQKQSQDGRRKIGLDLVLEKAESWEGLSEQEICERIVETKPNYKRIVGMLPSDVGLTRAIMAAAVEAGSLSNTDLIILTPTLEELGLLKVKEIRDRWKEATDAAENQRAANIAARVKTKEVRDGLQEAGDKATQKALEEATRDLRVYVIVDKSASMQGALEKAKQILPKWLHAIPLDRLHVSVFNTAGREVQIRHASAAGVTQAFRSHMAGGGTNHSAGLLVLADYKPKDGEDALIIWIGDQGESRGEVRIARAVEESGINPVAFGLLEIEGSMGLGTVIEDTARRLAIPCFRIEEEMFNDPYSVTRTFRNLIASTPVSEAPIGRQQSNRVTLVEQILRTPLLEPPVWATTAAA